MDVDKVVQGYLKLREARSKLKREYEEQDEALKAKMEKLTNALAQVMVDTNSTQLGSNFGTVYRQVKTKASCADWPSLWGFVAEENRFDFLEKRLSAKAINDFINETGVNPPGVNLYQEYEVVVRKK